MVLQSSSVLNVNLWKFHKIGKNPKILQKKEFFSSGLSYDFESTPKSFIKIKIWEEIIHL